jgi:hypothetical protein
MVRSEFKRRHLTCQEFALGPLRWRSTSLQLAEDCDTTSVDSLHALVESLQALIQGALWEGRTSQELDTIFRQHPLGDRHVDA